MIRLEMTNILKKITLIIYFALIGFMMTFNHLLWIYIDESNYQRYLYSMILQICIFFIPPASWLVHKLIKNWSVKKIAKARTFILVVIICMLLAFLTSIYIYAKPLFSQLITYSGSCELVYKPLSIKINNIDYRDTRGYFYQLVEESQHVFSCYTNRPCKCNSNIETTLLPELNIVLKLNKVSSENCERDVY